MFISVRMYGYGETSVIMGLVYILQLQWNADYLTTYYLNNYLNSKLTALLEYFTNKRMLC